MSGAVASPCVGICRLDARSVCTGGGRSLQEIAAWSQASPAAKQAIVTVAAARRAQMAAASAPTEDRR